MKNILIIVNKSWEVDPVINAMMASKIKPSGFPFPVSLNIPASKPIDSSNSPKQDKFRAEFEIVRMINIDGKEVREVLIRTSVWCIEDLMNPKANSSSSEEKQHALSKIFTNEKNIDLVIAFGTAGFNDRFTSFNGSVVIGSEFCSYDAIPDNQESKFKSPLLGKHLPSNIDKEINKKLFRIFSDKFKDIVESKLIATPNSPASKAKVLAAMNYVAISNVNITNYNDYAWADEEGISHYHATGSKSPIGSIETTHAVIRMCSELPTIFISAISDRLGYFNSEVTPSQNYVASFNGGILLSYLIPELINVN
jgi:hypothetical protein